MAIGWCTPNGVGISTLRLLPVNQDGDGLRVVAIAEITAEYNAAGLPTFHAAGVQRLNALAVHGAYHLAGEQLRQTAQVSICANEPNEPLAVRGLAHDLWSGIQGAVDPSPFHR